VSVFYKRKENLLFNTSFVKQFVGFTKFKIPHKLRVLNLHLPSTLKPRTNGGFLMAIFGQKGRF